MLYLILIKGLLGTFIFFLFYKYVIKNNLKFSVFLVLFCIHFGITLLAYKFTNGSKNDATNYFNKTIKATSWLSSFGISAKMIPFISYPFVKFLKFDYQLVLLFLKYLSPIHEDLQFSFHR